MKRFIQTSFATLLALLLFSAAGEAAVSSEEETTEKRWTELVQKYSEPARRAGSGEAATPPENEDARIAEVLASWWDTLSDDVLTDLIGRSLQNNRNLQSARAKVAESRAALGVSRAARLPWLDNGNSWTRVKTSENGTGTGDTAGLYHLGLDASWEIDLFGQRKDNIDAAAATLEADYASLHDVWVSLSAEVALTYVSLRTLQSRLDIAQKNLALRTDTLDLVQSQYTAGLTNALALSQAQYSVEEAEASVPTLRVSLEETLNALAILVGKVPGSLGDLFVEGESPPKPEANVELVGIPAEALRQRPDIRAAERRLAAQAARRKSAEKDLLPKFSLLGSIGLESLSSGNLFSDGSFGFSFGPRITLPIFHGGAIRRNIRVQSAREEQLLAAYEQAVLSAAAEVRNVLTANARERERNASLKRGAEAARNAFNSAEDLYRNGLADFNNVILTQQALLSLEEACAVSDGQVTSNVVRLFKALGGGWEPLTAEAQQ